MTEALLRLGTRGSPLALAQAHEVRRRLGVSHPALAAEGAVEIVVIKTTGDKVQDRTLAEIGGKGLFTKELDEAMAERRIDIAVHSMKDLPTWLEPAFTLGAVLEREDVRDAFICLKSPDLASLPSGSIVGTASLRRGAQILLHRPDLLVRPLRGNVETRLKRLAEGVVDATLLAVAGLKRLGMVDRATEILDTATMLPAVAQGAIAITCREADARTIAFLVALDHAPSRIAVAAERAFLAVLDGSCRTPIAGLATVSGGSLAFKGCVLALDGAKAAFVEKSGDSSAAETIGRQAGEEILSQWGPIEPGC